MNYAVIVAGGSGTRTGQDIPKQFMFVNDKPVIIWTLEKFQKSELIDEIIVVCIAGWETFMQGYANQFNITKLKSIITGGSNRFASMCNAIASMEGRATENDVVLFFDANRPLISQEMIEDAVTKCNEFGGAIGVMPCYDSMYRGNESKDFMISSEDRDYLYVGTGPDTVTYGIARKLYDKYKSCDVSPTIGELLIKENLPAARSKSSAKCIKLTTAEDLEIFKALLQVEKFDWLK